MANIGALCAGMLAEERTVKDRSEKNGSRRHASCGGEPVLPTALA
jgi:hypothetical protein